jgi:uncharacterized lipoprotein YmbA
MNPNSTRNAVLLLALAAWGTLTGCSAFKPVAVHERHFVLSPLPPDTTTPASRPATTGAAVGVGPVHVAGYLMPKALAVRRGPNEVRYSDTMLWAERLDKGAERVLTKNLAQLLPQTAIKPFLLRSDEVSAEVWVQLDQFDVDATGQGVLEATWRIAASGGVSVLRSGRSRHTMPGPPPSANPDGAVATLSVLLGKLSQELAEAVTQATAR